MRRKIEKDEGFTDGEVVERWSGKRIILGLTLLVILLVGSIMFISNLQEKTSQVLGSRTQLEKAALEQDIKLPSKEAAEDLLETAKKELSNLTPEQASNSGDILTKIIQDIQKIKDGETTPLDTLCSVVCGN